MGFGAGKLLQDFVNIAKLMRAGYKKITINLVDPCLKDAVIYKQDNKIEVVSNELQLLFGLLVTAAKERGIEITFDVFETIADYREAFPNGGKAHIISAVDFEDRKQAFNDVVLCHQILNENGKFYFSYDVNDLTFSSTQCVKIKRYTSKDLFYGSIFKSFEKDVAVLSQKLSGREEKTIRYAQLGWDFNLEESAVLLPELAKSGCSKIELTLIKPGQGGVQCNKESLEYYLKLFLPKQTAIEIRLVDSFDSFKSYVQNSNARFDIVTCWGHYSADEKATKANIRWIREHLSDSSSYYAMRIYKGKKKGLFTASWKWSPDGGTKLFAQPIPQDAAVIDEMMR